MVRGKTIFETLALKSGAAVTAVDAGRNLYVTGDNKKVQHAKYLLRSKVVS